MRNIRTVALGLAIASGLMLEFFAQAIHFLTGANAYALAQAIQAHGRELAYLPGLQMLPGVIVILFSIAAGLLVASLVMPFIEDAIAAASAMTHGLFRLVRLLASKAVSVPRD